MYGVRPTMADEEVDVFRAAYEQARAFLDRHRRGTPAEQGMAERLFVRAHDAFAECLLSTGRKGHGEWVWNRNRHEIEPLKRPAATVARPRGPIIKTREERVKGKATSKGKGVRT